MPRAEIIQKIFDRKIIAVIRLHNQADVGNIAHAIVEGGITTIEITVDTANALEWITTLARAFKEDSFFSQRDCTIGAGTILSSEIAHAAIKAGAQFLVSPILNKEMITIAHGSDACAIPSGFTPTEIWTAWQIGADAVKIFPMTSIGPEYIKALRGPLSNVPLIPSSGVTTNNAKEFLRAGAAALGAGTSIVTQALADAHDYSAITHNARAFRDIIPTL